MHGFATKQRWWPIQKKHRPSLDQPQRNTAACNAPAKSTTTPHLHPAKRKPAPVSTAAQLLLQAPRLWRRTQASQPASFQQPSAGRCPLARAAQLRPCPTAKPPAPATRKSPRLCLRDAPHPSSSPEPSPPAPPQQPLLAAPPWPLGESPARQPKQEPRAAPSACSGPPRAVRPAASTTTGVAGPSKSPGTAAAAPATAAGPWPDDAFPAGSAAP